METDRSALCGCKGIRTCLICEKEFGLQPKGNPWEGEVYSYCFKCNKCHPGNNFGRVEEIQCVDEGFSLPGIFVLPDFVTLEEEAQLLKDLDAIPWSSSQSGRRKQNFGPKCNFKRRKLKLGDFNGFPSCTKFLQERFSEVSLLEGFRTIEQCSLEYDPKRGASIEPHVDDCWVWGERVVTVSLGSDCPLTLTPYRGPKSRYNLDLAPVPPDVTSPASSILVRVPMPARSLLVLYSDARYLWEHMIYREDITSCRVCIAYREFTPPYLPSGELYHESQGILKKSLNFFDT